jgi:hypothetical protein
MFGPYSRPYRERYRADPFSHDYVRHILGWYAQKHPDEDFAETFAVWLDPRSQWRERYASWTALRKLEYVDRVATEVREHEPVRSAGQTDVTTDEMEQTVGEFYRDFHVDESPLIAELALDADLLDIFDRPSSTDVRAAAELLHEHRRDIVDKVNYWTGVRRTLVRELVLAVERRLAELELVAVRERSRQQMIELTVYITALAMTFLTGKKPLRHRRPAR